MTKMIIEPFAAYQRRGRPTLRAWKHRKTMCVEWNDCGLLGDYIAFKLALDSAAMNAELLAIWKRCKPQCDRRASFSRGGTIGFLGYVPHEAGLEGAIGV
jgi:hypothetical protein